LELSNNQLRVSARRAGGRVRHEIATSRGTVVAASVEEPWTEVESGRRSLMFTGPTPAGPARLTLTLPPAGPWLRCRLEAVVTGRLSQLMALYEFRGGPLDFSFAPHIRPADDHVVAQWGMKTPAAILQSGPVTMALALDPQLVTRQSRRLPLALELEADPLARERPLIGAGVKVSEPVDLNYFRHRPELAVDLDGERVRFGYLMWAGDTQAAALGYREVASALWRLMGSGRLRRTVAPQVAPFEHYARAGLGYAVENLWLDLDLPSGPGGAVLNGICYPDDVWFQSLFNHLRSAIGFWGFGQPGRARRVKNLALSTPQLPEGPFKTIFRSPVSQGRREHAWVTSSHWMLSPGVEDKMRSVRRQNPVKLLDWESLYHSVDCSWTAYWMLRWHREVEADQRLVAVAARYAEFLLGRQTASGAIPSFFRVPGLEADPLLSHNVGTAASGALLAALHLVTGDERFLRAARRAARFVEQEVLSSRRWQDYEVVFDSGAKPLGFFDRHTQQYAQTTQGMSWAAAMFQSLYRATGEPADLERAGEVVDYLSLYQQLWDPAFLSVRTFGGFPVGNSHPSWNDARTALLATTFADQHALTGEPEYLERAVAALRASMVLMFLPENRAVSGIFDAGPWGHADEGYAGRGRDERFTGLSFDFPVGAALSSITLVKRRYGDAYVDAARAYGLGLDACRGGGFRVRRESREGGLRAPLPRPAGRKLRLVVDRPPAARTLLSVNRRRLGVFTRAQLRAGVRVSVAPE